MPRRAVDVEHVGEAGVEAIARALLRRYGVVFKPLLARESLAVPWRALPFDGHYYSVPHALIRRQLDVRLTATTVECLYRGQRPLSANIVETPATLGMSGGRWR